MMVRVLVLSLKCMNRYQWTKDLIDHKIESKDQKEMADTKSKLWYTNSRAWHKVQVQKEITGKKSDLSYNGSNQCQCEEEFMDHKIGYWAQKEMADTKLELWYTNLSIWPKIKVQKEIMGKEWGLSDRYLIKWIRREQVIDYKTRAKVRQRITGRESEFCHKQLEEDLRLWRIHLRVSSVYFVWSYSWQPIEQTLIRAISSNSIKVYFDNT